MAIIVLSILLIIFAAIAIFLSVRLILFKNATKEIAERLDFILTNETNIGIDLSLNEKCLSLLVSKLNKDISKLKHLKNEYRKKDIQLREAITNISHDLRTPLTVITSYINLVERTDESINKKTRDNLAVIKGRAIAMSDLIEELFSYSMLETERIPLDMSEISLNDALEKNLAEFYVIITEHGINPQINICEQNIKRKLNGKAIDRIISNILSNAVKYSSGDLSVTLSENGEITFTNTAKNIDTVAVGKLFDRFFTVESARSSTGLGLSIAKILTQQMNGTISAAIENEKLQIRLKF